MFYLVLLYNPEVELEGNIGNAQIGITKLKNILKAPKSHVDLINKIKNIIISQSNVSYLLKASDTKNNQVVDFIPLTVMNKLCEAEEFILILKD